MRIAQPHVLHRWLAVDGSSARIEPVPSTVCMNQSIFRTGEGKFRAGIISWELFVFKERGANFPWRNLGVAAVQ